MTASTTATLTIPEDGFASTTPVLIMDIDGNGTVDAELTPGEGVSEEEFLSLLKGIVRTLDLPNAKKLKLIKIIDKIEKILKKEDRCETKNNENKCERKTKQKLTNAFEKILLVIQRLEKKKLISHQEALELTNIIGMVRSEMIQ